MDNDVLGYSIVVGSLVGLVAYFYLVFLSPWAYLVIRLSAFLAVAACLLVVAWAGYTYTTTPTEDLDLGELDIEMKITRVQENQLCDKEDV